MKLHRQLLSALFLAAPLALSAESIDAQQAAALAAEQLESTTEALTLVYTATDPASGEPTYYAFNREGGGFALVAADDCVEHVVLGYNYYGAYDHAALPDNARHWMDGYSAAVSSVRQQPEGPAMRRAPKRATTTPGLPTAVAPLIGDPRYIGSSYQGYIFWTQYAPFNNKCPMKGDERAATGCVATSMAMVMSKHKHPSHGQGETSYLWNGETLTASFDHDYDWDGGLLYRYGSGEGWSDYNGYQAEFISTLLRDCGYAVHMSYGTGYDGSGAAEENACKALCNYFQYDRSVSHLCRDYCTNDYWEDLLRREIAAGRPVMYGGGSDYGAHEFTCDGYDAQGRFYFHFGTSGLDGYYATLDPGVNYTTSQTAIYRIMPNSDAHATGKATMVAGSNKDFYAEGGRKMTANVRFFTPVQSFNAELAVAVENATTGAIVYEAPRQVQTSDVNNQGTTVKDFEVVGTYPDGTYNVYPVYRRQGADDWQKVLFGEYCQDRVTLTVSGGAMTFSNEDLKENIDEGKVKVDGIVYILDNLKHTATVTYQNSGYNSYRGDIIVPETFSYNGQTYTVTSIGEKAFYDCSDATSVALPATVTSIAYGAFYKCKASTITFAEGSLLSTIANYGFAYAGMTTLALPEGLTSVGGEAFVGCYDLTNVVLPTTLTGLPKSAFSACSYIRHFTCKTATPPSCSLTNDPFENVMDVFFPMMTLYVPAGSAEAYRAHEVWGRFGNIVEGEGPGAPDTPDPGTGGGSDDPIPGTYSIQLYGTDLYFSTAQVNGYSMTTCSLSDKPEYFYVEPSNGGYTITSAKNDRKIGYSAKAGTGLSLMDVCDVASTWTIEDLNGGFTRILRKGAAIGLGADDDEWASAVYTNQSSSSSFNCYWTLQKVEGEQPPVTPVDPDPETPVTPDEPGTVYVYTISPAQASDLYFTTTEVADGDYKTYSLSATPEYFRIVKADSGFTLQSTRTGKYAGYGVVNSWDFSDDATAWTIANFESLQPTGSEATLTTTFVRWHAKKNTNTGFGCDAYENTKGVFTDKASTLQWIIRAVAYEGDTVGLVANMVQRALAGKCRKEDVDATVRSLLLTNPEK